MPTRAGSLRGRLRLPEPLTGLVVFAQRTGSDRLSPRNRYVASTLVDVGLGTLLLDLHPPGGDGDGAGALDVELLAARLDAVVRWLRARPEASGVQVGLFGSSTGAAVALWAAADPGLRIAAVVSRGGRPDLASARLASVTAPTLLIVGSDDPAVLHLNEVASTRLGGPHQVSVVPRATHLFAEPGALAQVALLTRGWFGRHLRPAPSP